MQQALPGATAACSVTAHGGLEGQHVHSTVQQQPAALAGRTISPPQSHYVQSLISGTADGCAGGIELETACSCNMPLLDQLCSEAAQQGLLLAPWASVSSTPGSCEQQVLPWRSQHSKGSRGVKVTRLLTGLAPADAAELQHVRSWMAALEAEIAAAGRKGKLVPAA